MLTTRIYRPSQPLTDAVDELRRGAGTQFCPRCVSALDRLLANDGLAAYGIHLPLLATA